MTRPEALDLNLLVALDALLDERSVTRAAERLHLSVPATSRTLARIRAALGDEILVRAGREMVPTARAAELAPRVRVLLADVEALLSTGTFDPAALRRTFTIRASDAIVAVLAGPLLGRLRAAAPGVRVRFIGEGEEDVAALRTGAVDLDFTAAGDEDDELLREPVAPDDRYTGIVRREHPLASQRVTARRLCAHPHIGFSRRGRLVGPLDAALAEIGLAREVVATVASPSAGLLLVARHDLVLVLTEQVGRAYAEELGLHLFPLPVATPPLRMVQCWHPRSDADPAHRWLRGLVRTTLHQTQP